MLPNRTTSPAGHHHHPGSPPVRAVRPRRLLRPWLGPVVLAAAVTLGAQPAQAVRVASWNLLNYTSGREPQFRTVLAHMDVDVLFVEEILSQAAVDQFRNQVLEVIAPGEWAAAPFVNGPDTDSAAFYRTDLVEFVGLHTITTALRNIYEYTFQPVGYSDPSTQFRAYVVHLKASDGSTEAQQRLAEVTLMRTRMETFPPGQNYFVTGDFNIYRSSEPAYAYMLSTAAGTAGVLQDPLDLPGDWHDNASFASIHTQSPRTTQFGGGANGGLDDRFDMLLVGPASRDDEGWDCLEETYAAIGQDGLHFNKAIIDLPTNQAVPPAVAQAIHDGSDHLPLVVEFQVPALLETEELIALGPVFVGTPASQLLPVSNPAAAPADELDYTFLGASPFTVPVGSFAAEAEESPNLHPIGLDTALAGLFADAITIASDDPDQPEREVSATGIVLRHAVPSVAPDAPLAEATLDFGVFAAGPFPDQDATVHNFGWDAIQGFLDVHSFALVGDPRFALAAPFDDREVGGAPESWAVGFDGVGANIGTYEATLTFHTRDQQDVPGATPLGDLVFHLTATVEDGADIFTDSTPTSTRLQRIEPNPFGTGTEVVFALAEPGRVQLSVFDASGRALRILGDEFRGAGEHRIAWDGRDGRGRELGAGIYFLRLHTPAGVETRHVVKVR